MRFDLAIRNATVATASDLFRCDIGISDGKVVALATDIRSARENVDAEGMLVLPGGIDAHCHLDQPIAKGSAAAGAVMADDLYSGGRSALAGGTTTIVPFAVQLRGTSLSQAVADYHRRAQSATTDYGFHLIISDPTPETLEDELPSLVESGYTSIKIYMTYEQMKLGDGDILKVLAVARREGAMVMIHAENYESIAWLTAQLEAAGKTAPKFHGASRPMAVEREATHRAITLAELLDVPILFVHVSGREALQQIRDSQWRGLRVYAETCPQYLALAEEEMPEGFEAAKCVCSPPVRSKENQSHLWDGLAGNAFQIISSDHAPYRYDDPQGKKVQGDNASFRVVPNGMPGLATRMPVVFSEGVQSGRITLNQFVALTATNAAKLYGLYPQKGTIAVGSDADFAIWDPNREVVISNRLLHHNVDYTPFEGRLVRGWPMQVYSRGELVCRDFQVTAAPGRGKFIRRALSEMAKPAGRPASSVEVPVLRGARSMRELLRR